MGTIVGRNIKVEVALTFVAAATPTGISKASPAVITLAAHGLANGTVGVFQATAGMVELNEQAFYVNNQAAGNFECAGLDTTDYTTFTAAGVTYTVAATWGTLTEAMSYSVGGGTIGQVDDTRLNENKTRNIAGLLPSEDLTINIRNQETDSASMLFVRGKAVRGLPVLLKITKGSTVLRVAYGTPSLPGEDVSTGAGATGTINIVVPQWVTKPNV